jgi:hypothetical protein
MRKSIYIIVALLALALGQANAQRYLPSMRGIELRGGTVDGKLNGENIYTGLALSTYTKSGNRWVIGGEYLQKGYAYKDISIPLAQITGEGGYYFNFLSDGSKTFFLSLGTSLLAGYETSNWSEKLLFDGSTLQSSDSFIYGGAITLELECYLTDKVVLLLNTRERVLWGTPTGQFHTQYGIGIKFIIN